MRDQWLFGAWLWRGCVFPPSRATSAHGDAITKHRELKNELVEKCARVVENFSARVVALEFDFRRKLARRKGQKLHAERDRSRRRAAAEVDHFHDACFTAVFERSLNGRGVRLEQTEKLRRLKWKEIEQVGRAILFVREIIGKSARGGGAVFSEKFGELLDAMKEKAAVVGSERFVLPAIARAEGLLHVGRNDLVNEPGPGRRKAERLRQRRGSRNRGFYR